MARFLSITIAPCTKLFATPCQLRCSFHLTLLPKPSALPELQASVFMASPGLRHAREFCAQAEARSECTNLSDLRQFVDNLHAIRQVHGVLKDTPWSPTVEQELERLNVVFTTPIVAHVLVTDISTDTALSFFNWFKNQKAFGGCTHNFQIYGLLIGKLRKAGCTDEILALIQELQQSDFEKTFDNFNRLLAYYWNVQHIDGALGVWRQMEEAGVKPQTRGYNKMIDLYLRTKRCAEAAKLFSQMLQEGCAPNVGTYTLFIKHFVEIGRPDVAYTIFRKFPQLKIRRPTALSFSRLSAFASVGYEAALKALGKETRKPSNYEMVEAMRTLRALAKAGETKEGKPVAPELWADLFDATTSSQTSMFASILDDRVEDDDLKAQLIPHNDDGDVKGIQVHYDPCVNPHHLAGALTTWTPDTISCLDDAKVEWTSQLVSDVLKRIEQKDIAWKFFCWLEARSRFKHDHLTVSRMILLLASDGNIDGLGELVDKAMQQGFHLSSEAVDAAITAFGKFKLSDEAVRTFRAMETFGIAPNANAYKGVIYALVQEKRCMKAKRFFEEMQQAGLHPTLQIISLLIECFGSAGMTDIADRLFEQIQGTGLKPDADAYASIIRAHFGVGEPHVAKKLLKHSQALGVEPTQDLIVAMVKGLNNMKMRKEALALQAKYRPLFSSRKFGPEERKEIHDFLLRNLVEPDALHFISHCCK